MWLKICGGALLCCIAILLLKSTKGEILPLQWTGTIVLGGAALLLWQPVLAWVSELCTVHGVGDTAQLLLKGLGVAVLTQLCADLCRQSSEAMLANSVEHAGRAEILLLCLPLLQDVVETAQLLLAKT